MKIRYTALTLLLMAAILVHGQEDPTKKMEGTWLFVKAASGEKDISSDYVFGFLDGKARKMTLQKGGALIYEEEVVSQLNITKATWSVEPNEAGTTYYLNLVVELDGMASTSREKILVADGKKLIFGKRMTYEYVAVK